MAIEGSTTLKSYFEKGDQPTSAQFSSLIDSAILIPVSGASAKVGFVEIESTASATSHSLGTFNRGFLLDVANTAAARNFLAITSASGGGGGAAGQGIAAANTTASVVSQFGVIPVANLPDASAASQGIIEIATTAEVSGRTDTTRAVTPAALAGHPGVANAAVNFTASGGSTSIRSSYNVSAVDRIVAGSYKVAFVTEMPNSLYTIAGIGVGVSAGANPVFAYIRASTGSIDVSSAEISYLDVGGETEEVETGMITFFAI